MSSLERFALSPLRLSARLAALAVVAFLAGCVGTGVIVRPDDRPGMPPVVFSPKPVLTQRGPASFYWEDFRTASGERFHPEALTAAHRTFPLQSWVKVTNERNNRTVIVRINDRGPYIHGRIIDLSRGAARQIDMIGAGVVPVRVDLLRRIDVVEKPNLRITPEIRAQAEARAQARAAQKPIPAATHPLPAATHAAAGIRHPTSATHHPTRHHATSRTHHAPPPTHHKHPAVHHPAPAIHHKHPVAHHPASASSDASSSAKPRATPAPLGHTRH